ncbi:MAG: Uma2 family endonuclease [Gemmataceae bacterium]
MPVAAPPKLMTFEEFMAIPYDGVRRWLDKGVLRVEGDGTVTIRNRFHSEILINVGFELKTWLLTRPIPRGAVVGGEAGFRLGDDSTMVGADVAYVSAEVMARQTDEVTVVVGVPTLAVEILSPSTTQEDIDDKVAAYREAGTPLVWVIDPRDRTVTVYRAGEEPALVNVRQELDGGPQLPGFRVPAARLFP